MKADGVVLQSDMLSSMEVYKTVKPDMDAAVFGAKVNLLIREVQKTPSGASKVELWLQDGYNNLHNTYKNYEFIGRIGKRSFNNKCWPGKMDFVRSTGRTD